jgi:O-antigen/teichoic acid export membrane protein
LRRAAPPAASVGRRALSGSAWVLVAEGLAVPSGLLTVAVATRFLGPGEYGLFALAATAVAWVEWGLASGFARAGVRLISEASDWRPAGTALVHHQFGVSVLAMLALWLLADPIADQLGEPRLTEYLRLYAIDIPLFGLAQAHRGVLIGLGHFGHRAMASAGRWTARALLIVILLELGLSVEGAILGSLGASVVELAIARWRVRPTLLTRPGAGYPMRRVWGDAGPLFALGLGMRVLEKLDLVLLKALGGSAEQAGIYAAAQNLTIGPGLVALAASPILLATLSRLVHAGAPDEARGVGREALRLMVVLAPIAAIAAAVSPEVAVLLYGRAFTDSGPLAAVLMLGAAAMAAFSLVTSVLIGAGRSTWSVGLVLGMLALALIGHLVAIPRWGPLGAAVVTSAATSVGALGGGLLVYQAWAIRPPIASLLRAAALCVAAFWLTRAWSSPGLEVVVKLGLVVVLVALAYVGCGEFSAAELWAAMPRAGLARLARRSS